MGDTLTKIVISAVDQTKSTFDSVSKNLNQVESAGNTLNGVLGRLAPLLGAATFTGLISNSVEAADKLNDVAKANEVTVASVLKLSQALVLNGGESESASKLFSALTKSIDDAASGSKEAQAKFKLLNISLKDLATLDGQQLFEKTLSGLVAIEDPLKRNALAMDTLGKSAKGVDIKGLADDYASNQADFAQAEKSFNDIGLAMDKLDSFTMNTSRTLATSFGPSLLKTITYVDDMVFGFDKLEKNILNAQGAKDKLTLSWKPAAGINDKPVFGQFDLPEEYRDGNRRDVVKPKSEKSSNQTISEQIELIRTENNLIAQGIPLEDAKTIAKLKQQGVTEQNIVQLLNLQQISRDLAKDEKARSDAKLQLIKDEQIFHEGDVLAIETEIELENEKLAQQQQNEGQMQAAVDLHNKILDGIDKQTEDLKFQLSIQGLSNQAQQEKINARNAEIQLQQTLNELADQGVGLTEDEINALRDKYSELAQIKNQIKENNVAAKDFGLIFKSSAEEAITNWKGVGNLIKSIAQDIEKMLIRKTVTQPMMNLIDGAMSKIDFGSLFANADGGTYSGAGISAYSGSVVSSPTLFPFAKGTGLMGEAGAEGIFPLKRGKDGKLGVSAEGHTGTNVIVNLIESPGNGGQVNQSQSENNLTLDVMVEKIEGIIGRNISQGRGIAPTMERQYGLNRAAGAY